MGRKSKKNKGKVSFQEIELALQEGNVQLANKKLTQFVVKRGEEEKYAALKTKITHQVTVQYFQDYEFDKVPNYLTPNLGAIAKKDPSADLTHFDIMMGVAYLYQQKTEEAIKQLQPLSEKVSTAGFYFLLSILYQPENNANTWNDFAETHRTILQALSEGRQKYIEAIFHLQKESISFAAEKNKQVVGLLESIPQESRSNLFNLQVLKNILATEKKSLESLGIKAEKIKPLYKVLSGIPLSGSTELDYVQKIPALENRADELQMAGDVSDVIPRLEQLLAEGKVVSVRELEKIINSTPEKYQPYVAYHQIALIANQGFQEAIDERNIMAYVNKFTSLLLAVPEGGMLYFSLSSFYHEGFKTRDVLANLRQYLSNFGKVLLPTQQGNLAWLLYRTFRGMPEAQTEALSFRKSVTEIVSAYPDLLGLKWWLLLTSIFSPNFTAPKETLDIFNYNLSPHTQKTMLAEFKEMLKMFSSDSLESILEEKLGLAFGGRVPVSLAMNTILGESTLKTKNAFSEAAQEYGVHPTSKILLDCYQAMSQNLAKSDYELTDEYQNVVQDFEKDYEDMLSILGENHENSKYFIAYQSRNLGPEMEDFMDLILYSSTSKSLGKKADKMIATYRVDTFINHFVKELDEIHYEEDFEEGTVKLLLHLHDKETPAEESPLFIFGKEINRLVRTYDCSCPMDFLITITNELGKSSKGKKLREEKPLYPFLKGVGKDFKPPKLHKPVRDFQTWLNAQ